MVKNNWRRMTPASKGGFTREHRKTLKSVHLSDLRPVTDSKGNKFIVHFNETHKRFKTKKEAMRQVKIIMRKHNLNMKHKKSNGFGL